MIRAQTSPRQQIGALPYFVSPDGEVQVVLVTTRETQRWSIPKGNVMKGKKPHRAAEIEAFEEAGVRGQIGRKIIGSYGYRKNFRDGKAEAIVVVYPLQVHKLTKKFPERRERKVASFPLNEAIGLIAIPELAAILAGFHPAITAA